MHEPLRMRALKPDLLVLDRGDIHWRGAFVAALGASPTIQFAAEQHFVRQQVVALDLLPVGARSLLCSLAVRVTGDGADSYVIREIVATYPIAGSLPSEPYGAIPRSITHEPVEYDWTR
jgi:hypothetical protein